MQTAQGVLMFESLKKHNPMAQFASGVVASFFTLLMATSCGHPVQSSDVLRVGLSADFAPFCFVEDRQVKGFDVDLIHEIAKRLHTTVELHDLPFETLIPELTTGKLQLVLGGMTPTQERAKHVFFSTPYLEGGQIVALTPKHSIWSLSSDYKLARIVVCMGYTSSDDYVCNVMKLNPLRLGNLMDCLLAIQSQQADVLVGPRLSILPMIEKEKGAWQITVLESAPDSSAILISKHSPQLQSSINKVIEEMKQDGFLKNLKQKWNIHD